MTAPFTASNGYTVHVNSVGYTVVVDEEGRAGFQSGDLWEGDLRALVEYAATIGITAPDKKRLPGGCDVCGQPATRLTTPGAIRFCGDHGGKR